MARPLCSRRRPLMLGWVHCTGIPPVRSQNEHMTHTPRAWWRTEDWVVVWIGLLALAAVLLGYKPVSLAFKWKSLAQVPALLSPRLFELAAAGWALSALGVWLLDGRIGAFSRGFPAVFLLGVVAHLLAGQSTASSWGIEFVIFALAAGLLVSNTLGTPAWLLPAVRAEFYIKTGIILMGATIIFSEILQAGALGILQSVLVVTVVWYFSFWLAKRLRLDDEFAAMLSTAVSICGVSAAIAACGAIQGDRRKLSYVTSIVLIVAVPMIVIQPWLIRTFAIPDAVAGAWLGGTLDTTGSVVAAGELISETATKVGTIVKFSQNVLIGLAAFLLSLWWSARSTQSASPSVIWERFPKFVLGFVAASLFASFVLLPATAAQAKPALTSLRNMWFAMAFVSIGLETKFTDLLTTEQGRPFWSFLGAQTFNAIWTLLLAWLIFGGILFDVPKF
ncbi:MAG: putative sulfate exporter family transporter [Acidobacteria bacterium]|nr:putative sulfate exporter family transporter [Acidobacteriota bacterium]